MPKGQIRTIHAKFKETKVETSTKTMHSETTSVVVTLIEIEGMTEMVIGAAEMVTDLVHMFFHKIVTLELVAHALRKCLTSY